MFLKGTKSTHAFSFKNQTFLVAKLFFFATRTSEQTRDQMANGRRVLL